MSSRLSILHLIEAPSWTGAMAQTLDLIVGLRARGHRVALACSPGSILEERAREAGIDVTGMEMRSELNPVTIGRLSAMVWSRRAQIVHAHRAHAHSLGLLTAFATGRPFLVTRRVSFRPKDNLGSRVKYASRHVTRIIAVSEGVKDVLVEYGIAPERIEVIYSGSDPGVYEGRDGSIVRRELGIPGGAPLVGKIANFYHGWKGHDTFLDAAAAVARTLPDARFLLVGHRTCGEKMRRMIAERGLAGRVIAAGYRTDVPDVIAALDVSVNSPRAGEGLSGAVRESLAGGRPVVATDVGGNRELVRDGETGLLVPPDDPEALAEAMLRLLRDRGLADALASAGARTVRENLTTDRMVERTEALYREVLAERRGEAPRSGAGP